jgi:hypothetical protein
LGSFSLGRGGEPVWSEIFGYLLKEQRKMEKFFNQPEPVAIGLRFCIYPGCFNFRSRGLSVSTLLLVFSFRIKYLLKITLTRYRLPSSLFFHLDEPVRGYKNFPCVLECSTFFHMNLHINFGHIKRSKEV